MSSQAGPPRYLQIKDELRQRAVQGGFGPGDSFVTQREICETYGVSMVTAARVLNELVGEGLIVRHRGKGTFIAERLPSSGSDSKTIVCIVPELTGTHVSEFVRGVSSRSDEGGFVVQFHDCGGAKERQSRALAEAARSGASAVVLYPLSGPADIADATAITGRGIPLVFADRYWPEVVADAVVVDDFMLGYELTRRLITLGHKAIATLWVETDCTSVRDRIAGHLHAVRESGLHEFSELTQLRDYAGAEPHERIHRLRRLLSPELGVTAFLCANGYVLWSLVSDLLESEPEALRRVDLAGMDESGPREAKPPITQVSAQVPSFEMGRKAAGLAIERVTGRTGSTGAQRIVLPVVVRERKEDAPYLQLVSSP